MSRYQQARERSGLTMSEAALSLGVDPKELESFELETTIPDALVIRRMALLYKVTSDWLIGLVP